MTTVKLEILSRRPETASRRPPLVLIHGAWHAAWCWQDTFLDWFAEHGWEAHAPSLRGHGESEGRDKLRWWSIADYVADVDEVVQSLGRPPVLVGHSMGGFVVQKYLEKHTPAGAVLLASAPPSGILKFYGRVLKRHPLAGLKANLTLSPYAVVEKPAYAQDWFFSPGMPEDELAAYHARLQDESFRALLDMLALDLPKPRAVGSPVAVLGAGRDAIFSVAEIEATARAYGVEARIYPDMAHNMAYEPGWQDVAAWIAEWAAAQPA